MPPLAPQSAFVDMSNAVFSGPARSGLLGRAYTIFEQDLALWIVLDILTTAAALSLGAFEKNAGPAYLMSIHPALWVAGLLGILILTLCTARALSKHYQNNVGVLLLLVPVLIECQAVTNNFGVIGSLL